MKRPIYLEKGTKAADADPTYGQRGFGRRLGFGSRPCVLVVDFILGFTDLDSPLAGSFDKEIAATARLLAAARKRAIPVIFSTVSYDNPEIDAGLFVKKVGGLRYLKSGSAWVKIDPRLSCKPTDLIIEKKFASCFFGTPLASYLNYLRSDTLIVAGCTTSGCVRATVVDALQHGYRPIVVLECVGDRAPGPHTANLFDMDSKYADIVSLSRTLSYVHKVKRSR